MPFPCGPCAVHHVCLQCWSCTAPLPLQLDSFCFWQLDVWDSVKCKLNHWRAGFWAFPCINDLVSLRAVHYCYESSAELVFNMPYSWKYFTLRSFCFSFPSSKSGFFKEICKFLWILCVISQILPTMKGKGMNKFSNCLHSMQCTEQWQDREE